MMIKRKRSDSEVSANLSSPLQSSFQNESVSPFTRDPTPAHLSSRTRKRHRDNRPDENRIHEHTMSLLYAAQRHNPSGPIHSQDSTPSTQPDSPFYSHVQPAHQASLHSFWPLPSSNHTSNSNSITPSPPPAAMLNTPTRCEDCEAALMGNDDRMDIDMDVHVDIGVANLACTACGKHVCHRCAISNLGAQRRCLICAGRRKWVGGLGWVDN